MLTLIAALSAMLVALGIWMVWSMWWKTAKVSISLPIYFIYLTVSISSGRSSWSLALTLLLPAHRVGQCESIKEEHLLYLHSNLFSIVSQSCC